jgi:carbamoyl-phosphate synthase small subunit
MAEGDLNEYLKANNIVAIEGIDTRALGGAYTYQGRDELYHLYRDTGCRSTESRTWQSSGYGWTGTGQHRKHRSEYELGDANASLKVAVLDYGVKKHILECLVSRGAHVRVHPAKTVLQAERI